MKTKLTIITSILMLLNAIGTANATSLPQPYASEYHACTFNDRSDFDDLERWIDRWDSWMDQNENDSYNAYLLTPLYGASSLLGNIDFVWVGNSENNETLLEGRSRYMKTDMQSKFPAKCSSSFMTRTYSFDPPENWSNDPNETAAIYRSCMLIGDKTIEDAYNVRLEVLAELRSNGFNHSSRMIIPGVGASDDYDFVLVSIQSDLKSWGNNADKLDDTMRAKLRSIRENIYRCENSRAYVGKTIRSNGN
tara:strand:+ start:575 stop:1324 length:750 start_codon:yes stop_codon:yes gene_type:complete